MKKKKVLSYNNFKYTFFLCLSQVCPECENIEKLLCNTHLPGNIQHPKTRLDW